MRQKRRQFKHSNYDIWYDRRLKEAALQVRAKALLDATFLPTSAHTDSSLRSQNDQHIYRVMDACYNNRSMAADMLGLHRRTLQRILPSVYKRLGKKLPKFSMSSDLELMEVLKRQRQGKRMYRKRFEYEMRA